MSGSNRALVAVIEELESIAARKAELAEEEQAVKAAAKARGFSLKVIGTIIRLRKMTPDERAEYEGLVEVYKADLGMLDGSPLGRAARDRLSKKRDDPAEPKGDGEASDDGDDDAPPAEPLGPTPEDIEAARAEGGQAFRDDKDILDNPYGAADPRRAAWDEGYCMEGGSDGMDLPDAWRPASARKKDDDKKDDAAPDAGEEPGAEDDDPAPEPKAKAGRKRGPAKGGK